MKDTPQRPSFRAALRFWCKLGWISFGGTAAHIAIMHDELVEKKRWISNRSFLHALSHCMILPGPEAQQLSIYIGWKLHGKRGGIVAGTLFVLPSMFILLALSVVYVRFGSLPWIAAVFNGRSMAFLDPRAFMRTDLQTSFISSGWKPAVRRSQIFLSVFQVTKRDRS